MIIRYSYYAAQTIADYEKTRNRRHARLVELLGYDPDDPPYVTASGDIYTLLRGLGARYYKGEAI